MDSSVERKPKRIAQVGLGGSGIVPRSQGARIIRFSHRMPVRSGKKGAVGGRADGELFTGNVCLEADSWKSA